MNPGSSELLNEARKYCTKSEIVAVFCLAALFGLVTFAWKSHSVSIFNGLATPLTFAVCGYLLVTLPLASGWVVEKKHLVIVLLLSTWILIADTQSGQFLPALARDTHWLLAALLAVSISRLFRRLDHVMVVLQFVSATCILALLLTLFSEADTHIHWLLPPIFGHIRHLGLTIGLFTVLLYLPTGDSQMSKLFFRLSRIAGMSLVIWSGTRASILGILVALAIVGLLLKKKQFLIEAVTDIVVATLLSMIPPPAFPGDSSLYDILENTLGASSLNQASSFRLSMWADTINWLADHERLFLGAGGNGFARIQTMWHAPIFPPGHIHPHNVVVQILTDWGIPGLALSLVLIFSILLSSIGCLRADSSRALAFGALSYIFTTSMFDATLYHLEFLIYFSVIMGVITAGNQTSLKVDGIPISKSIIMATLIIVIGIHLSVTEYRIGLSWYFPTR
ncbi:MULTISPECIES: O-antigen ligase family protein [Methylobacter]